MRRIAVIAYVLICADFILTRAGIVRGIVEEANPLLVGIMTENGQTLLALVVIGCLLLGTYALRPYVRENILRLGYWGIIMTRIPIVAWHFWGWWQCS